MNDGGVNSTLKTELNFPSRKLSLIRSVSDPRCNRDREWNSYRSWLERIRKERPPFLTIVSLELPESSIPLIESQASARTKVVETKDDILDELLDKVTPNDAGTKSELERRKRSSRKSRRRRGKEFLECTKGAPTLEECTKNIVQGQFKVCSSGERLLSGIPGIRERVRESVLCTDLSKFVRFARNED